MQAIKIKGDIFRSLGENERARGFYDELLRLGFLNYPTIESRSLTAIILAEEGKADEARAFMDRAILDAERKDMAGIGLKARFYLLLQKQADGAREVFEKEVGELQKEVSRRELLHHDAFEGWAAAVTAEIRGDTELALTLCRDLQQRMASSNNVWAEFQVLRKIMSLSAGKSPEGTQARERVNELLADMALTATTPAVKGSFQKFRNRWRRYVNVMST